MESSAIPTLGIYLCLVGRFVVTLRWDSNLSLCFCVEVIQLLGFCFLRGVGWFPPVFG